MSIKDKLERYAPATISPKSGSRRETSTPYPDETTRAQCEHISNLAPLDHKHGVISISSLGSTYRAATKLLLPDWESKTLDFKQIAFIDTETTGLSGGAGVCAFLVGIGYLSSDGFVVDQFFMKDFPSESDMLQKVCETLEKFDIVASYNGRAFDIPLLETRLMMNLIPDNVADKPQLDLLHTARRIWKHRLSDCSLKSIEAYALGFIRKGDIDGWLIPQTYFEFLRSGDRSLVEPIISHNYLDILSLACVAHLALESVETPNEAPLDYGCDWFGLGTLFEKHRRLEQAAHCFQQAITMGLPRDVKSRCLKSLSLAHKRKGSWEEAIAVWSEDAARADNTNSFFALEELAKFYEHRRRDLNRARETCLRAMALLEMKEITSQADIDHLFQNFEHRLKRIELKIRRRNA